MTAQFYVWLTNQWKGAFNSLPCRDGIVKLFIHFVFIMFSFGESVMKMKIKT